MAALRWVVLGFLWVLGGFAWGDEGFLIRSMDVSLTLSREARLLVVEQIEVEFLESRRGIFREIPVSVVLDSGGRRSIRLRGVQVEGGPAKVSQEGGMTRIRIGDPDVFLPAGTVVFYRIQYEVEGALNWFGAEVDWEPRAEVFWNATGNDWPVRIGRASVRVSFPLEGDSGEGTRGRVFYGLMGATTGVKILSMGESGASEDGRATARLDDSGLFVEMPGGLGVGEGVTVVLGVPSSVVPEPGVGEQVLRFVAGNPVLLLPVLVGVVLGLVWLAIGRDPKMGPVAVRFEPPAGLSAAFCGVLTDNRVDGRDFAAGMMSLAVKGYLKFGTEHPHGLFDPATTFVYRTEKAVGEDLSLFESKLLSALRLEDGVLFLSDIRTRLASQVTNLVQVLKGKLIQFGYYRHLPEEVSGTVWALAATVAFFLFFFFQGDPLGGGLGALGTPLAIGVSLLMCLVLVWFFAKIMPSRTPLGALKHWETMGFFEAMRGRAHYMDWLTKKQLDQAKYEEYLPFAVAFGLTDEWARVAAPVVKDLPTFCDRSAAVGVWDFYLFHSVFARSLDRLGTDAGLEISHASARERAASSSSSSSGWGGGSGFGGGGFSGGGFGGGGGGSW